MAESQEDLHSRDRRFCRRYATQQSGRFYSAAAFLKIQTWSLPTKMLDRIKDRYSEPQGCESAKQKGVAPCVEERFGQRAGPFDGWMPFSPIFRDVLQVRVLR